MKYRTLFCAIALALVVVATAVAADVAGKWVAQVPGRGGQTVDTTFNFKVDGDNLTGTVGSPMGELQIQEGKVTGDAISFKVKMEFGGNAVVMLYTGKVSRSEIKFTRKREGGERPPQEFTAKRAAT